ncbi:hypothetical protein UA75_25875 [Actinoalloteichus sp. GBA129-24]|nr:hypothetical protein UA75_25875 [Actinoalloteichus sp. GBA129-24]
MQAQAPAAGDPRAADHTLSGPDRDDGDPRGSRGLRCVAGRPRRVGRQRRGVRRGAVVGGMVAVPCGRGSVCRASPASWASRVDVRAAVRGGASTCGPRSVVGGRRGGDSPTAGSADQGSPAPGMIDPAARVVTGRGFGATGRPRRAVQWSEWRAVQWSEWRAVQWSEWRAVQWSEWRAVQWSEWWAARTNGGPLEKNRSACGAAVHGDPAEETSVRRVGDSGRESPGQVGVDCFARSMTGPPAGLGPCTGEVEQSRRPGWTPQTGGTVDRRPRGHDDHR